MKSLNAKRSVIIAGHKTSVSLEDAFWKALKEIAIRRNRPLSVLVASIDQDRCNANLSSAIRLFVLDFFQAQFESQVRGSRIVCTASGVAGADIRPNLGAAARLGQ
jgi:predicted DNA-binding ribbon-helix-helix protein